MRQDLVVVEAMNTMPAVLTSNSRKKGIGYKILIGVLIGMPILSGLTTAMILLSL